MNARTLGYWASTGLLSVALLGSAAGKLTQAEPLVQGAQHLGIAYYVFTLLGVWYLGAAIALLVPGLARLKEWAYAGVFFAFTGAIVSHVAVGDPLPELVPLFVLLAFGGVSHALRPESRRL